MSSQNHMNSATSGSTPLPNDFPNPVFCCRLSSASNLFRDAFIPESHKVPLEAFIRLTQQTSIEVVPQKYLMGCLGSVTALIQIKVAAETATGYFVKISDSFFAQPPKSRQSEREEFFELDINEANVPTRLIKMDSLSPTIVCDQMDGTHPMLRYKIQIWGTEDGAVFNGAETWKKEVREGLGQVARDKLIEAVTAAKLEAERRDKRVGLTREIQQDRMELVSADSHGKPIVKVLNKADLEK